MTYAPASISAQSLVDLIEEVTIADDLTDDEALSRIEPYVAGKQDRLQLSLRLRPGLMITDLAVVFPEVAEAQPAGSPLAPMMTKMASELAVPTWGVVQPSGRVKVEVMDLGPLTTVASPEIRAWWGAAQTFKKHSRSLSSSLTSFFFGRLNAVKRKRRNRRFRRNFDPNRPTVVAEGDSWVLYPWKLQDVAEHLAKATNLSSVGAAGDELKDIVTEQQHLDAINKLTRDGRPPSALVFSAGGNDILGARFKGFLKRYSDGYDPGQNPERFLDFEAINNAFEHIEDHYSTFFDEMAGAYPEVAIYVHGYDYAEPGGNGEPIQAVPFHQITGSGDWLSEALEGKHIFAEEDQDGIIRVLVNRYNTRLQEIVSKRSPTEPIRYIDARGIVKEDWANEIHPNTEGFRRVAEEFKALLLPTT